MMAILLPEATTNDPVLRNHSCESHVVHRDWAFRDIVLDVTPAETYATFDRYKMCLQAGNRFLCYTCLCLLHASPIWPNEDVQACFWHSIPIQVLGQGSVDTTYGWGQQIVAGAPQIHADCAGGP